jgi:xylulose-5-phosphate/fructose-6-phosphate phosphoketolase
MRTGGPQIYLSVGQTYLCGNPLLKQMLTKEHIKPRLLGHWETTPSLNIEVQVIKVVNLMKLQSASEHPHGLPDRDFDALFTADTPIIFAFHGYPWLIDRLTYRRTGHRNIRVRGYKEEDTTTTPFDMCVLNDLNRFHLVADAIDRVPHFGARAADAKQAIRDKLMEHKEYICPYGDDMPEIKRRTWGQTAVVQRTGPTEADNA